MSIAALSSKADTASSSRSHSFSVRGYVHGTIRSKTDLETLNICGGVGIERLRIVGWTEGPVLYFSWERVIADGTYEDGSEPGSSTTLTLSLTCGRGRLSASPSYKSPAASKE